jgi:hypothetical protein
MESMTPHLHRAPRHAPSAEGGFALLTVVFLVLLLGGLSLGLLEEGLASRASVQHHEDNYQALATLEVGIAKAEVEVFTLVDSSTDGIGVVSGTYAAGDYEVTAVQDPDHEDRWTLTARGTRGMSTRRVEVGVRRRPYFNWSEGLFSKDTLDFGGDTYTDSYDSTVGPYVAVPHGQRGHLGSNGGISLTGTSVLIQGNAIPGPLQQVTTSGNPTITGDTAPREFPVEIPDSPIEEFEDALLNNNNASLLAGTGGPGGNGNYNGKGNGNAGGNGNGNGGGSGGVGGTLGNGGDNSYDPDAMTLYVKGTVTLTAGTYFFTDINMDSHGILVIQGAVRIYCTGNVDLTGGSVVNSGSPRDLQLFVHAYALPAGHTPPATPEIRLRGDSAIAAAIYAPASTLNIAGGCELFGAAVADTVIVQGDSAFHYDESLRDVATGGVSSLERLYWRELSPPVR